MMELCTISPSLADILSQNRKIDQTTDLQKVTTVEIHLKNYNFWIIFFQVGIWSCKIN